MFRSWVVPVRSHANLIEAQKGQDIRAKIFQCAVSNQWVVLEMSVEQVSLEDIFQKLTQSDAGRSEAA